jgi:soluble lytic murein transglycosylase
LPLFQALAAGYPELADYALYFAGTTASRRDDQAAEEAFSRLLRDYPQSLKAPAAALGLGQLFLRAGRFDEARVQLRSVLAALDASTAQGAHLGLAEVDEGVGNVDTAYVEYMEVRRAVVGSAPALAAKQRLLALRSQRPDLVPAGQDLLSEARLLLAEHDYAAAEHAADQLLQAGTVEPATALRVQADALVGRGEVETALARLRALVDQYAYSYEAPGALFQLASTRWNRDQDEIALNLFAEFRRRYPEDDRAPEALYATGRIHQSAGRNERAVESYTALLRRYPRSKLADEAQWRVGWIRYVSRDWQGAASWFARLAGQTSLPQLHNGARYWEARALEHSGRASVARGLYRDILDDDRTDYYAWWAERRLGSAAGPPLLPAEPRPRLPYLAGEAPGSGGLAPAPTVEAFHFSRWAELRAAGVFPLARDELKAIERDRRDDTATLRYLLRAYTTVDGFAAAQSLLRRLGGQTGLSLLERQRLLYPLAFWTIVSRGAQTNAVDPFLVEAVMRQESLFDPEARSPANACGLMQLLPQTAARVASKGRVDPAVLFEPETNIELGTHYLNGLLSRFGGDVLKAVAAYNGGEAAVQKWEQRFSGLEADEFIESITYRETRDYVKRVISNYRAYEQLYSGAQ